MFKQGEYNNQELKLPKNLCVQTKWVQQIGIKTSRESYQTSAYNKQELKHPENLFVQTRWVQQIGVKHPENLCVHTSAGVKASQESLCSNKVSTINRS